MTVTLSNPFEAWGEYTTDTTWQGAIGDIVEMNLGRNETVRACVKRFGDEHPEVDLDHLPMIAVVVRYAATLGYALARTYPDGIEDMVAWVERAWAYGELGEPVEGGEL